jgi:hypothetical protein
MRFALLLTLLVIGIPLVALIAGREWSTPATTKVAAIELQTVEDLSRSAARRPSSQSQPVKRKPKAAVRHPAKKVEKRRPAAAILSPAPVRAGGYDGDDDDDDDDGDD